MPAPFGQIGDQRIDHAPNGFVDQSSVVQLRVTYAHRFKVKGKYGHRGQLFNRNQFGADAVVDVMVVVGDFVGKVCDLRQFKSI
jgi:hypothetical protein